MSDHEKIPSQFRPSKITVAMLLGSFILVSLVSWRAVESANASREDARDDAIKAVAISEQLQRQNNCIVRILTKSVTGVVDNSVFQNDLLLASVEATDRNVVIQKLKDSRANLGAISAEVHAAQEECTK